MLGEISPGANMKVRRQRHRQRQNRQGRYGGRERCIANADEVADGAEQEGRDGTRSQDTGVEEREGPLGAVCRGEIRHGSVEDG